MNMIFLLWAVLSILFLIAELSNPGLFFFFSFSLGAFITGLSSFYPFSCRALSLIFLGSTILAFIVLRLWVKYFGSQLGKAQETNMDAFKGRRAVVVSPIKENMPGYVSIDGVLWRAYSDDSSGISNESWVEVIDVRGAHVVVRKLLLEKE